MIWVIGILLVVLVYGVSLYNGIVYAQMKVQEARSGIDVALAKRYAVLSNMQESVKGYMRHEKDVLEKLTQIRSMMSLNELYQIQQQYQKAEQRLYVLAESYPELKASELFHDFNEAIVDCEEHLQAARRFYNSNVTLYNEKILTFPSSLFASLMHKEQAEFFAADSNEKEQILTKF